MKKVLVFGTFDILHKGHLYFLKEAKKFGRLNVVVARESTVKTIKKKAPLNSELTRLEKIKRLKFVDNAFLGHKKDKCKVIEQIKPDVICLGYDQDSFTDFIPKKIKELNLKTKVVRLKHYKPKKYKSSLLREKI